jgi:cobalt-zinc-cadmium efflux system outer membrane protein
LVPFNLRWLALRVFLAGWLYQSAFAQQSFNWQQIKDRFEAGNPNLRAAQIGIDESKANQITAYLRPNPGLTTGVDQINPFTSNPYRPLTSMFPFGSVNYLHERQHKRELRLQSAQKGTGIAVSQEADLRRTLMFSLRNAFVQTLQAKAVLANAKQNLAYWDNELRINRERLKAGDISQVDQQRLELQRVQFESDYETSMVNLRTAKIQLLTLMNDRTPVDTFDVDGPFDFREQILALEEFRKIALDGRPDLQAAVAAIDKARTDHRLAIANGSADPTFGMDFARNPPIPVYFGVSMSIPLKIFDRNQGEKARTELDIHRNERLRDAAEAQVFSDVDSAYNTLMGTLNLLKPYKTTYLEMATKVRDTVAFAYQRGGATLLDYLDAEKNYRDVRLAYLNLVGSFLTAGSQLNMAVGQEVIQ